MLAGRVLFSVGVLLGASFLGAMELRGEPGEAIRSSQHRFRLETVAAGLSHPWAVAKLPTGGYLITERGGRLLQVAAPGANPVEIRGIPAVWARGQGGLLDVALHPDYSRNGWVYLTYSKPLPGGALTAVVRGRVKDGMWVDQQTIFEPPAHEATNSGVHFGSRLAFDGLGHVFFSIGDRGGPTNPENLAQSLSSVTGKIHRLQDDGKVPADNPFVQTPGAVPSIWAYGSRNAQGLVFDSATGRLWETEHGPRGGDELNIIRPGANYGWPVVTYGINYSGLPISRLSSKAGMENPVVQWTPVIAASGLAVYRGKAFPRWEGHLFAGGLAGERLVRLQLSGDRVVSQEVLLGRTGRIRDVRSFGDGPLYVVYDDPGKVIRLVPLP